MGFEVLLKPIILALALLAGFVIALSGISREVVDEDEETGLKTHKYGYSAWRGITGSLVALGGVVLYLALVVVPHGHVGVTFSMFGGVDHDERGEGLSLQLPLLQNTIAISVQEQLYEGELPLQTKDLQEVKMPVGVNYAVDGSRAAEMYQDVGTIAEFEAKIIKAALEQFVKAEAGLIEAGDIPKKRFQLAADVEIAIEPRLAEHGVVLTFVSIEDAVFQAEFIKAVQDKVIAEEEAQEQFNLIQAAIHEATQEKERAEGKKQAAIKIAEGEGQAIREIADALGFTPEQYLQWLLETQWNGQLPDTLVGDAGEFGILLDIPAGAS